MSQFQLHKGVLVAVIVAFLAAVSSAEQPNKTSDKKDDKKDTKSNSDNKGSSAPARDSAPAKSNSPSPNQLMPNYGPSRTLPNNIIGPITPHRLLTPNYGNNYDRSQWEHDQQIRDQQRSDDERRQRDMDDRDRKGSDRDERNRDRDYRYDNRDINAAAVNQAVSNNFHNSGSLISFKSGQLVMTADGVEFHVRPDAYAKIAVVGTAGVDALKPGQVVKLQGKFESPNQNQLKGTEPVAALDIVTPHPGETVGQMTPVDGAAGGLAQNRNAQSKEPRALTVVGQIVKFADGELTLDMNGKTLKTKLDPAATVNLRSSDLKLANAGDTVEVTGYYLKPGYGVGKEIKITLAGAWQNPPPETPRHSPPATPPTKPSPRCRTNPSATDQSQNRDRGAKIDYNKMQQARCCRIKQDFSSFVSRVNRPVAWPRPT